MEPARTALAVASDTDGAHAVAWMAVVLVADAAACGFTADGMGAAAWIGTLRAGSGCCEAVLVLASSGLARLGAACCSGASSGRWSVWPLPMILSWSRLVFAEVYVAAPRVRTLFGLAVAERELLLSPRASATAACTAGCVNVLGAAQGSKL